MVALPIGCLFHGGLSNSRNAECRVLCTRTPVDSMCLHIYIYIYIYIYIHILYIYIYILNINLLDEKMTKQIHVFI